MRVRTTHLPRAACYLPWLKVSVALLYVLTFPLGIRSVARGTPAHSVALRRKGSNSEGRVVQLK